MGERQSDVAEWQRKGEKEKMENRTIKKTEEYMQRKE